MSSGSGGASDIMAIMVLPQVFKMEIGNYFIDVPFPLEMNQNQDKPLYLQGRVCRDSKSREDALTGVCFGAYAPSAEQASCPCLWVDTIHQRL